jgi:hypothetical protein
MVRRQKSDTPYTSNRKSVSPVGKTLPFAKERLDIPRSKVDPELVMAKMWEHDNIRRSWMNSSRVPIDLILHECNDRCRDVAHSGALGGLDHGTCHHYTGQYADRDIMIIAATVQYLATPVGRAILREFQEKIDAVESAWLKHARAA